MIIAAGSLSGGRDADSAIRIGGKIKLKRNVCAFVAFRYGFTRDPFRSSRVT